MQKEVMKMTEQITIQTEYITLGQFLKLANVIQSGGMAKWFLGEHDVFINDEQDQRRGRKLRDGDTVFIPEVGTYKVKSEG
ncbi:S4 domain protein YaaA [Jeotgalibacillus terrae]|nr:S4 domain protein YaaA [Jeotgalibacillus terrae]